MKKAFTLLEVLVSFAIMASLLTLILQSQGEIAYFTVKQQSEEKVRREIEAQILAFEREDTNILWSSESGTFNADHPLQGYTFKRTETTEKLLGQIPVTIVSFLIQWKDRGAQQSYESKIIAAE